MTTCMNWNPDDVEQLRIHFLKGLPIKLIARTLSRTPGAVNKALSRFHIRTPRIFKERRILDTHIKKQQKKRQRGRREKESMRITAWTSFRKILEWLDAQNVTCVPVSKDMYSIHNRPYSKMQVVMHANKLRLERGYDIFLVEGITW